jgi:prepilin-type N-terminal cleavage/methylation domain-containing protein
MLIMLKLKSLFKKSSKGFTLIELLIVIAILGILAAATLATIDPIDKIRAGNDSKVQSDIASVGKAAEAYAAANNGTYPSGTFAAVTTTLIASGDLRSAPAAPGGYTAYTWTGGGVAAFIVSGQLRSKKYTATPVFKYTSATGKSCDAVSATGVCP